MAIAEALRRLNDADLERLFRLRPELADPAPATFNELATRASTPHSVQAYLQRVDVPTAQVLDALAFIGQPASAAEIAAIAKEPPPTTAVVRVLDVLRVAGIIEGREVSGDAPMKWTLTAAAKRIVAVPFAVHGPIAKMLERHTVNDLRSIVHNLGITERPVAKVGLIADIAAFLSSRVSLHALLSSAPPHVVELLGAIDDVGGSIAVDTRPWALDRVSDDLRWLIGHALLIPANGEQAVIPREVALALRGGSVIESFEVDQPTVTWSPKPKGSPRGIVELAPPDVLHLIASIASAWEQSEVAPLRSGGVAVKDVRALAKRLGIDDASIARLIEIAGIAGLVSAESYATRVAPTKAFDDWIASPPLDRWMELVRSWACSGTPISRVVASTVRERGEAPLSPAWFSDADEVWRRALLMQSCAAAPHGAYPDLETVVRAAAWPSPARWFSLASPVEAAVMLFAEAALLGVTRDGALTALGRAALFGSPAEIDAASSAVFPPSVDTFTLQGDHTAVAPAELDAIVATELALVAAVESKGAATVYRISEASLRHAFDAGRTSNEILDFLERHARPTVPQALRYLVDDVARRYGTLRVGAAVSYVRSDDPALLADLLRAKKTGKLKLRLLAPTVAVSSIPLPKLLAGLRDAGFLPVEEDGTGAVVGSVRAARAPLHPSPRQRTQRLATSVWDEVRAPASAANAAHRELVRRLRVGDNLRDV